MIPFTQPYSAPDRTTRRPLSERVPECRPNFNLWETHGFDCVADDVIEQCESALWCVAVADWVRNQGSFHVCGGNLQPDGFPGIVIQALTWSETLNVYAHMIADALAVPH